MEEQLQIDPNKKNGGSRRGAGAKKGSGGARKGAGRKKGSKNIKTIFKEEAAMEIAQKNITKKMILDSLPANLQRSDKALKAALKEINEEEIEEVFKKRIALHSNKLLTSLLTSALGEQYLYKVQHAVDSKGKVIKTHVKVEDPEEIQEYLDNPLAVEGSDYMYITTKTPDTAAINSLLDRMMGRPTTKVVGPKNADGSEGPIKLISLNYSLPEQKQPPAPVAVVQEVVQDVITEAIEE